MRFSTMGDGPEASLTSAARFTGGQKAAGIHGESAGLSAGDSQRICATLTPHRPEKTLALRQCNAGTTHGATFLAVSNDFGSAD